MAAQTLMSLEEYLNLPEQEGVLREFDEGKVIEMSHPSFPHGAVVSRVCQMLGNYVDQTGADFAVSQNAGFFLRPDVERAPDVCLVRKTALPGMEVIRGSLRGAPELAVEVVSESETAADMDRKVEQYLRSGVTAVWVLYPATHHVMIHRRSGETRMLGPGQTLEEPDLLPGFSVAVDQLFPL